MSFIFCNRLHKNKALGNKFGSDNTTLFCYCYVSLTTLDSCASAVDVVDDDDDDAAEVGIVVVFGVIIVAIDNETNSSFHDQCN